MCVTATSQFTSLLLQKDQHETLQKVAIRAAKKPGAWQQNLNRYSLIQRSQKKVRGNPWEESETWLIAPSPIVHLSCKRQTLAVPANRQPNRWRGRFARRKARESEQRMSPKSAWTSMHRLATPPPSLPGLPARAGQSARGGRAPPALRRARAPLPGDGRACARAGQPPTWVQTPGVPAPPLSGRPKQNASAAAAAAPAAIPTATVVTAALEAEMSEPGTHSCGVSGGFAHARARLTTSW